MKLFGFRFLFAMAFVGVLGLLASSPAMAYCRNCSATIGCYDVNAGATGYNFCNDTNGYCRLSGWGCTGFSCIELPGSCIDENGMMAPEATMVLAAGRRGTQSLELADLVRLDFLSTAPAVCFGFARPTA